MNESIKVKKTIKNEKKLKEKILNGEYTVTDEDGVIVPIEHTEEEVDKKLRIKVNNKNFFMVSHLEISTIENIAKNFGKGDKPGFVYLGYFYILLNTMDYDNRIDFNALRGIGLSEPMVKYIRGKLKGIGFIKRFGNDFYVNPEVATKGQTTPIYIIELFK